LAYQIAADQTLGDFNGRLIEKRWPKCFH
jgi:hypothetical protein